MCRLWCILIYKHKLLKPILYVDWMYEIFILQYIEKSGVKLNAWYFLIIYS